MKIICIGDSLTYGYGVAPAKGWVSLLNTSTPNTIINKGINGDTTVGILSRFYKDCIELRPDAVIIMAGTNDLLTGRNIKTVIDNIVCMIKDCVQNNIAPIVMTPPCSLPELAEQRWYSSIDYNYINDEILSMPDLLKENLKAIHLINEEHLTTSQVITEYKLMPLHSINKDTAVMLPVIDLSKAIPLSNDFYIDGIHLTSKANEIIYNILIEYVNL
ncbi:GDSL-type esterase/lipase family protein [Clostridium sp. C8-1-8]|uniref:GDSL-type esterase/lipase family protein n=1 Tax=Clostridium sp. C8-1-8 TaxID=2698831 RepID=UPI00136D38D6|nr:GDSL-type esterase/lipase family protein [Clostridium sp. C8-1-8]